jgi:hypothetical protein
MFFLLGLFLGAAVVWISTPRPLQPPESRSEEAQHARSDMEMLKRKAPHPPADRSKTTLADGRPVTPDHREINPATGMQKDYVVLSAEERAKGFVRPLRFVYTHNKCGAETRMMQAIAETYARDPGFYSSTFCVGCKKHFPVGEFKWDDGTVLGS